MSSSRKDQLDARETQMRARGIPDVDGWRARVDDLDRIGDEAHRREPLILRPWYSLRAGLARRRARRQYEDANAAIEREEMLAYLQQHPELVEALRRRDVRLWNAVQAELREEAKLHLMARSANLRARILERARAEGASEADLAFVASLLVNLSRPAHQ